MNDLTDASRTPLIHTELPGPNAAQLIAQDEQFTSPSYTRMYPLAVARGEGAMIEDVDGNRFLDFTAGIAVTSTGHCHPRVVAAIQEQASRLLHMSGTDFYYSPQRDLAQRLAELVPGTSAKKVFFTNSGAESVEAAIKLARHHTNRPGIIAFYGSFHGRTLGALSLTASKTIQRDRFGPLLPGVYHVDFPGGRSTLRSSHQTTSDETLSQIEKLFRHVVSPDDIAAIVVEPIQGEGGYIVPPPEFHRALKSLAESHGILYVADEVQSGMGRTGKMLAVEHFGVEPDVVCLAKGIASGMPLGAIVAPADVMTWPPGSHASTFGGNPVCCVAALETIELLEEGLIENSRRQGERLFAELQNLQSRYEIIGDVRGLGLMLALEFADDLHGGQSATEWASDFVQGCFRRGLLLLPCGKRSVRLSPPLVITENHVATAVSIIEETLSAMDRPV